MGSGAIQLPDFQREWKWDDERIRALIATVTLEYPLGVIMTLETGGSSPFRSRPLTGADGTAGVTPAHLLLDGQQRLTSLFQSLYLARPVQTVDARNRPLERWYYIDMQKAVDPTADRDEAIVSVPADKLLKADFARTVVLDLSTPEQEYAARHFPLHIVFDPEKVNAWQERFTAADPANWGIWGPFNVILDKIKGFQVPMIRLDPTTSMDAVCAVFERVNTGGVPLNVFELLTATYAGDQSYTTAKGDYYRLPDAWHEIKKQLASEFPVLGNIEKGIDDGLSSSDFLQAVSLVLTWERKQHGTGSAVSCKRRDLLSLPLVDFERLSPVVRDAFSWVGRFLAGEFIVDPADLPYRTNLVPLAAVRAILGDRTDEPETAQRIRRWYWCGVLGEMYGSALESRYTRDVEQLVAWVNEEGQLPDTITESVFLEERLDTLRTRNSAAYKGIFALVAQQGAVDWYFTEEAMRPEHLQEMAVDIRQIFPKAWLARHHPGDRRGESIVNKTWLSQRAARSMTGSPEAYLQSLAIESGTRSEWFDDVVATHLIEPGALRTADFDKFYDDRSRQLLALVDGAMGRRTVHRDKAV
ncbi:GmrSD restriction endonuclease domain-containing protein [Yinghuangia sp. YIM S10712]|uniref:GmrSD restriction endonuclease domain-containing protein n=1 Tax=Yinghuangia sp. YIM S10712 TaxID=3436930 RepID=UPI003F5356F4